MRLGKKSKDVESKIQNVDNISRLICTSKSQNHPFTGKDPPKWGGGVVRVNSSVYGSTGKCTSIKTFQ